MVTCAKRKCRVRTNLDEDGFCPTHTTVNIDATVEEAAVHNCGTCKEAISEEEDSKALQCDSRNCKLWHHLTCTDIPETLYDLIHEHSEAGIYWLCPTCIKGDSVITITPNGSEVDERTICNKFKHGSCPHGISGKSEYKGKVCEFRHPKLCKKFVKYGQGGRFGCKHNERHCRHFHPLLCRNSVRHKKCLNQKCTFTHIKGTIRKEVAYVPQNELPSVPILSPCGVDDVLHASQYWASQNAVPRNASPSNQRPRGGTRQVPSTAKGNQGFLGRGVAQTWPPPEIVALQVQMKQLGDLVKQVLRVPFPYQENNSSPLNQYWPPLAVPQNQTQ